MARFPAEIQDFGDKLIDMQEKRHWADYDPEAVFSKAIVIQDLEIVLSRIESFERTPIKDHRAFAIYLLLSIRNQ